MNSASPNTRWIQLLLGLVCMIVISSPQYVWALFTQPLTTGLGASLPELQITFSILIVVQTFLSPWQGVLVDRFGPRLLLSIGVLVTGLSWILAAQAASLTTLYLTYGLLGGVGTGIVYVGVIGHMVQWFPDKRGLATGLVAAGYGVGALLTTFPIATVLRESTYDGRAHAFRLDLRHSGSRRGARVATAGRRVADGVESARAGGDESIHDAHRSLADSDARHAHLLAHVRHDDDDVDDRADGDVANGSIYTRLRNGECARVGTAAVAAGALARSHHERGDAPVLWLGLRSIRP
jgi:hypothetical protein